MSVAAKIVLSFIAISVGGWMIFDGAHVLITGKYFGPAKPGPWSSLVSAVGLTPFSLGIPFIIFGLLWLFCLAMLYLDHSWAWYGALLVAILTLWYLPLGTAFSLLYIAVLLVFRSRLQA